MKNIDSYGRYVPEILVNFIKEGIELNVHYELAKRKLGGLTAMEVQEDLDYWKDRLSHFYQYLGWNPKLIKILNN